MSHILHFTHSAAESIPPATSPRWCAVDPVFLITRIRATDIFIYPPHQLGVVDVLLTNFHLPRSTLLALVMAFAGVDLTHRAYARAIDEKYRFYSFGDAMLIV